MNFVGHAEVARWTREEPAFLFGAMLPDFMHMARARVLEVRDAEVAAGIAHHHRVDSAFHGAPTFVSLCTDGVKRLVARGVRRGTARAVAHVGTELLLDGLLVGRPEVEAAYVGAIAWAAPEALDTAMALASEERARFEHLGSRLRAWGAPHDYRRPRFVAERVAAALAPRPRLALEPTEREHLEPVLEQTQSRVEACAEALLAEVRERLEATRD